MLRVAAQVLERQHRNRRLVGQCQYWAGQHSGIVPRANPIDVHWPSDVFELLVPHVFEDEIELARGILLNAGRDADAARLGQSFEPCCDIDAVAKDVAILDDDVADIDPDAELDAVVGRHVRVAPDHFALHLDGTAQCIHHTAELDEQTVASGFDEAATVSDDLRIYDLGA